MSNNKPQIIGNINLGGWADSEFHGAANSVLETNNLDIHSEPGIIKMNQALKKVGNTDSLIIQIIPCSDGEIYHFGTNGKVYSKGTGLDLETTIGFTVLDAIEFDGYIYFSGVSKIGRVAVPTSGVVDWSTKNENFGTYTNAWSEHPMWHQNMILYIGDGNLVAQVDSTTGTHVFTPDALDLQKQYKITTLGKYDNDLLIGATYKGLQIRSEIFRWNTWSVSYSTSDPVPESSINSILAVDNLIIVQAGDKGNTYAYNGDTLERVKRMPGDWSGNNGAIIRKNANANFHGIPLFGISNVEGNPIKQGVFSYGSWSSGYPNVLNHEYTISEGVNEGVTIGAIVAIKGNLLVSWSVGDIYGVDEIDWINKAKESSFESRKIQMVRLQKTTIGVQIAYRNCPNNIKLFAIENDDILREIPMKKDVKRKTFFSTVNAIECSSLRLKVVMYGEGNTGPEIEFLSIE